MNTLSTVLIPKFWGFFPRALLALVLTQKDAWIITFFLTLNYLK